MIFGKYVNKYYRKYFYLFIGIFLVDFIVDLVQLLIPMIIGNIVNVFDPHVSFENPNQYNKNPLRVLTGFTNPFTVFANENLSFFETDLFVTLLFVLCIGFIIFAGRIGWRLLSAQLGANIENDLRKEMFHKVINRNVSFFDKEKVGGLMSYFTNDLATIKMCFTDGMIYLTDLLVLGVTSIILMMQMSVPITLIVSTPLLLFIIGGAFIGKGESLRYKISNDAFEKMSDYTEENLQGFSVIKAYDKEKERVFRFKKYTKTAADTSMKYLKYSSFIDLAVNSTLAITFALLYMLCSISVVSAFNVPLSISGSIKHVGDLTKFAGYYDSLIWPMMAGALLIDYISRGSGAHKRIKEMMDKDDILSITKSEDNTEFKGKVKFNNLSFSYQDSDNMVLKNISIDIPEKTFVGVLGKTGSGKTTLVSLLSKIYSPKRGMLFIDDKDVLDWNKKDLNKYVSIVLQESYLFTGTIKDNIAFNEEYNAPIDIDRVRECAKFADIDKDIEFFKDGYDTLVGEKGSTLSGGQKQRISIARAMYKKPKLIIFDDSLSAVDADTEKNIIDNLNSKENKVTTIMISHRVSTIKDADLILVMDKGEIIDYGKHKELINRCKLYKDIYNLQLLEKEIQ